MIKTIVKAIREHHGYKQLNSSYWGRIGSMHEKYGEKVLVDAVQSIDPQEIPLNDMLNIIEKRCQYILENGEIDDLTKEILNA